MQKSLLRLIWEWQSLKDRRFNCYKCINYHSTFHSYLTTERSPFLATVVSDNMRGFTDNWSVVNSLMHGFQQLKQRWLTSRISIGCQLAVRLSQRGIATRPHPSFSSPHKDMSTGPHLIPSRETPPPLLPPPSREASPTAVREMSPMLASRPWEE